MAYRDGRVGQVPHEPRITVDTWWDLGINDRMSIWFTQSVGQELRVIDYLDGMDKGIDAYIPLITPKATSSFTRSRLRSVAAPSNPRLSAAGRRVTLGARGQACLCPSRTKQSGLGHKSPYDAPIQRPTEWA